MFDLHGCVAVVTGASFGYGKIDILVNNAGASRNDRVLDLTDEDWNFTLQADLTSVFKMTRAFEKYMVEKRYGRIINVASIYGQVGNTAMDTDTSV